MPVKTASFEVKTWPFARVAGSAGRQRDAYGQSARGVAGAVRFLGAIVCWQQARLDPWPLAIDDVRRKTHLQFIK